MIAFENVPGNALIAAPASNVIFAYFMLTFAVILCKYNMYTLIILGYVTFKGTSGKYVSKVLLMVLFAEDEALAAKIVSQPGKIGCIFKSRHITHAVLHFIMTPKPWMYVF